MPNWTLKCTDAKFISRLIMKLCTSLLVVVVSFINAPKIVQRSKLVDAVLHELNDTEVCVYSNDSLINYSETWANKVVTIFNEKGSRYKFEDVSTTRCSVVVISKSRDDFARLGMFLGQNFAVERLVAVLETEDEERVSNHTKALVKMSADNGIFNVAIVITSLRSDVVFTWNPLDLDNNCGRRYHLRRVSNPGVSGDVLFHKIPRSVEDCTFNVLWIRSVPHVTDPTSPTNPGLFVTLFNTLMEKTNVKMRYMYDDRSQIELANNGTLTRPMALLKLGSVDAVVGHVFITPLLGKLSYGPVFLQDYFVMVVPKPARMKFYRQIHKAFRYETWIVFLGTYITVSLVLYEFTKYYKHKVSLVQVLLDNLRLCVASGMNLLPRHLCLRMIIMFYILYTMNMGAVYVGKLSGIFTIPAQGVKIADGETLYLNNLYFNMSWYFDKLSSVYLHINNPEWRKHVVRTNLTEKEMLMKAHTTNVSSVTFKSVTDLFTSFAPRHDKVITYLPLATLFLTYFLKEHDVLNDIINYWSTEIIEKGLFHKWWKDVKMFNRNYTSEREGVVEMETVVVLSLRHYEETFMFLLCGYLIASVVLVFEFVFKQVEVRVDAMKTSSRI